MAIVSTANFDLVVGEALKSVTFRQQFLANPKTAAAVHSVTFDDEDAEDVLHLAGSLCGLGSAEIASTDSPSLADILGRAKTTPRNRAIR